MWVIESWRPPYTTSSEKNSLVRPSLRNASEFAAELPASLAEIRRLFTASEIRDFLNLLERTKFIAPLEPERDADDLDDFSRSRRVYASMRRPGVTMIRRSFLCRVPSVGRSGTWKPLISFRKDVC